MADTKISGLPASTTPLAGTEVLPIVQSGVTKQVSVANLTAGRAISATELTLSTGNLIIGTSGKGIDFSATPGTGTSELLADYEEGNWTPVLTGTGGSSGVTFSNQTGNYVKVGKQVTVKCSVTLSAKTSITGLVIITGLPFTANAATGSVGISVGYYGNFATTFASITGYVDASTTSVVLGGQATAGSTFAFMTDANIAANTRVDFAVTYLVD